MARLPTAADLSGPSSFRTGRAFGTADVSAAGRGLSALGQGIENVGASLRRKEDEERNKRNAVDIPRAEADKTEGLLKAQNEFDFDPDYSTFKDRAPKATGDVIKKAAGLIRDPEMRERWLAGAQADAARVNDGIFDRGITTRRQAETNAFDDALEVNRRIYVDPDSSDDAKAKARKDIEGAIQIGLSTGLLTPDAADARRKTFIDNADLSRGQLAVERDPSIVAGGFEKTLVQRESGGRPDIVNGLGYAGLYQFGAPRLADLGIYNPEGENLSGWSKRQGTNGKWTGTFNIPGFPEVKKLSDFLANPAAQKAAFEIHRQRMDQEIVEQGLQKFIGTTVGGVQITRDGIYGMMHLGGAAGAARALKSGGAVNAADANGTTLLAYAKMGNGSDAMPDWYQRLSPEDRQKIQDQARIRQTQLDVETRGQIDVAATNAPAAILNTGRYDGQMPTAEQFMAAYGPQEGAQKFNSFQASIETSRQAFDMRTMSAADIQKMVGEAKPTSSGDEAALQQQRYETLSRAAETTLKTREADPATYVRQTFPNVDAEWNNSQTAGNYQAAVAASIAAQQQIGIKNVQPLPKDIIDTAVTAFKDDNVSQSDRIAAVGNILMATPDTGQRQILFNQLVGAGLPDITEGAFEALSRGDQGAAQRLFQAAMVDPSKLPGKIEEKPAAIDQAIQDSLMAEGEIGDVYYGLSDGSAENFVRAQRDSKLINNAVNIRIRNGETLDQAIQGVAKDLYGDVQVVTGDDRVNAQIIVPSDQDANSVVEGLSALMPDVETAVKTALAVPADANASDGTKAILDAATANYAASVVAEGYFRNSGDGYVFIDPKTGLAVADGDGRAVIFKPTNVAAARPQTTPFSNRSIDESAARQGVFQ